MSIPESQLAWYEQIFLSLFFNNKVTPFFQQTIQHNTDIADIFLSQHNGPEQKLALIDKNGDLFVTPLFKKNLQKVVFKQTYSS